LLRNRDIAGLFWRGRWSSVRAWLRSSSEC